MAITTADGTAAFPWLCVTILILCMTIHSYTLASVYPYVGVMTKHLLDLPSMNEAGYYAGYVASSFTFGRLVSGYFWGYMSDKIGRKPVIIIGLSSIAVCSVIFGLSTSFAMAVTSRFILGITNGIVTALRSMTQEICPPSHVLRGMTYVSTARGVGVAIGTGIGGLLAQPALSYPAVFSPKSLFAEFPFFCPNLLGAAFALLALPLVVFFLPETLLLEEQNQEANRNAAVVSELPKDQDSDPSTVTESRLGNGKGNSVYHLLKESTEAEIAEKGEAFNETRAEARHIHATRDQGTVNHEAPKKDPEEGRDSSNDGNKSVVEGQAVQSNGGLFGPKGLLSSWTIRLLLVLVALVQTLSIGFDEVYPLWALASTDVGGLGWTIFQVGKVLTLTGVLVAVIAVCLFPTIIPKVGIVKWQRCGCILGIVISIAAPYAKRFSWNEISLFFVTLATNFLFNCGVMMNMLPLTLMSTSIVKSHQRGKLGGLFMTAESVGRTMGPMSFSNVLAWSISSSSRFVDFRFVFFLAATIMGVILALVLVLQCFSSFPKAPARPGETGAKDGDYVKVSTT